LTQNCIFFIIWDVFDGFEKKKKIGFVQIPYIFKYFKR